MDSLLRFRAEYIIEGHNPAVMTREELATMTDQMYLAGKAVEQSGADEKYIQSEIVEQTGIPLDADTLDFVRAFIAGRGYEA